MVLLSRHRSNSCQERICYRPTSCGYSRRVGRITKYGSKIARSTLVQCALVAMKYSPYLRNFYNRLKSKRGSGKAIIATARKLLNAVFYTLKHGWVFEDFPNFELKACN